MKRLLHHILSSSFWLAALSAPAAALEPLGLPEVLQRARVAELRSALDDAALAIAQADRLSAGARPNPVLGYGLQHPGRRSTMFDGVRQQDVSLELPLELGGQRAARVDLADLRIDEARALSAVSRLERATEAALALVALQTAQARVDAVQAGAAALTRLPDDIRGKDSFFAQRLAFERAHWRSEAAVVEAERAAAQQRLADLLDIPEWQSVTAEPLRPLNLPAQPADLSEHVAIQAARFTETAAAAGSRLARAERAPRVSVGLLRSWTDSPYGTADGVGFSVELPLFDRREGAVARAEAEARSAQLRRRLLEAETESEIRMHRTELALRTAAVAAFDSEVGPLIDTLQARSDRDFGHAGIGLPEVLEANRARHQARLHRVELQAGLVRAQIRLLSASGQLHGMAATEDAPAHR
jgi:cobalt-zinc-cadmium efflux system outer membrane protein